MSDDHDFEPIPGLPARLPEGESILWQGSPTSAGLAIEAFHARKVAVYFAALLGIQAAWAVVDRSANVTAAAFAGGAALATVAVAILAVLGWLSARTCIYTITTRRVVMRYGLVLPMVMNLPYSRIAAADLRVRADGSGDIVLRLAGEDRVAYFALWPHARPWRFKQPEPMLRAVPDVAPVARLLAQALATATGGSAAPVTVTPPARAPRVAEPLAA